VARAHLPLCRSLAWARTVDPLRSLSSLLTRSRRGSSPGQNPAPSRVDAANSARVRLDLGSVAALEGHLAPLLRPLSICKPRPSPSRCTPSNFAIEACRGEPCCCQIGRRRWVVRPFDPFPSFAGVHWSHPAGSWTPKAAPWRRPRAPAPVVRFRPSTAVPSAPPLAPRTLDELAVVSSRSPSCPRPAPCPAAPRAPLPGEAPPWGLQWLPPATSPSLSSLAVGSRSSGRDPPATWSIPVKVRSAVAVLLKRPSVFLGFNPQTFPVQSQALFFLF